MYLISNTWLQLTPRLYKSWSTAWKPLYCWLIKYSNEHKWQRQRMEKSCYFTELHLKNIMLKIKQEVCYSGKQPGCQGRAPALQAWPVACATVLSVSICLWRWVRQPRVFHLYKLYEQRILYSHIQLRPLMSLGPSC